MRAPSNLQLAGIFFLIAIVLMVLIFTHKSSVATDAPKTYADDTVTKYIDEVEKQNNLERNEKEHAEKLAKLAKAKRDSVECQFWKQQQKQAQQVNPRTDEKVIQFCELQPDQASSSTSSK